MTNTNTEVWGNIELPGLSDEELYSKNWNYVAAGQGRSQDPKWRENIGKANRNRKERLGPEYSKNQSEAQKQRWQNLTEEEKDEISKSRKEVWNDPDFRERMEDYYSDPEYLKGHSKRTKEVANRPERLKWYKEFNQNKRKDPIHIKKHSDSVKDRSENNEGWIRKNCRPVRCPYGIFHKASIAMDLYHAEFGGNRQSVAVKLRNWLHSDKHPEWKYLTWEEYDNLKSNNN